MSKTAQRKHAAYRQGLLEAQQGCKRRWRVYPHKEHYLRGYEHGLKYFPPQPESQKKQGFWSKLITRLFTRKTKP